MLTVINDNTPARAYIDEAGVQYVPVTALCHALTGRDPFHFVEEETLAAAIDFGNRADRVFSTLLAAMKGLCDPPVVEQGDWRLLNALDAMFQWVSDTHFQPHLIQQAAKNSRSSMAGTPDAMGLYGTKQILTIPDLKTGTPQPEHKIQVMLYRHLEGYQKARQMVLVYIDGHSKDYKEVPVYPDPATELAAFCMAPVLTWRRTHGF